MKITKARLKEIIKEELTDQEVEDIMKRSYAQGEYGPGGVPHEPEPEVDYPNIEELLGRTIYNKVMDAFERRKELAKEKEEMMGGRGYKASDLRFAEALEDVLSGPEGRLRRGRSAHGQRAPRGPGE